MLLLSAFLQTISNSLSLLTFTYVIRVYKCTKPWVINSLNLFFKHNSPKMFDHKEALRVTNCQNLRKQGKGGIHRLENIRLSEQFCPYQDKIKTSFIIQKKTNPYN